MFPLQYSAKNHELAREMHSSLISDTQVRVLIEGPVQDNRNCYDVIEIVHAPGEERTD